MNMNTNIKYILAFVAVVAIGVVGWSYMQPAEEMTKTDGMQPEQQVVETISPNTSEEPVSDANVNNTQATPGTSTASPAPTTNTNTNTTKQPPVQPAVKTFTMADVAKNNSATSCYSVVRGKVYDLTAWISKHPGGEGAIKRMCGVDGTAGFTGKHGGSAGPEGALDRYYIGDLAR